MLLFLITLLLILYLFILLLILFLILILLLLLLRSIRPKGLVNSTKVLLRDGVVIKELYI